MRLRAAVMSVGIAILALTGVAAPANAIDMPRLTQVSPEDELVPWRDIGWYATGQLCIDAAQQLIREHAITEFRCTKKNNHVPPWLLQGK